MNQTSARGGSAAWPWLRVLAAMTALTGGQTARGAEVSSPAQSPVDQTWAIHAQATFTDQGHLAFSAPYAGGNSLSNNASGRETFDLTVFAGVRPWRGAEVWVNPEVDQGFGLNNTLGVAAFPSGEAYKVGAATPYLKLQRLFLRQTINLSGEGRSVDADVNQLSGRQTANRLVITIGKFSVTDVFDGNSYAHDPRRDFLNWGFIDTGTFDYAADAWGYTLGAAAEWYQGPWTLRGGAFDLSVVPNSEKLDPSFGQFQLIGEIERRFAVARREGSIKLTGFLSRARMGAYTDAIALGQQTNSTPSLAPVRKYRSRSGVSLDAQQALTPDLGAFLRLGVAGGSSEPYEFADIDRTVAGGMSLKGAAWGRAGDTVGLAGELNGISALHRKFLANGGLGILIGDGRLPHYGDERILETYYDVPVGRMAHVSADYQFIDNPGFNRDRGPVAVFALRLHAQF